MSHTPEPWIVARGDRFNREVIITTEHRISQSADTICEMDVEFTGPHGIEQKANAGRIVACVNACAGISTENLEDNIPIKELATRYNKSLRQRDELLNVVDALCKQFAMAGIDAVADSNNPLESLHFKAHAALEKVLQPKEEVA